MSAGKRDLQHAGQEDARCFQASEPSLTEVLANDVDLADMSRVLTKKPPKVFSIYGRWMPGCGASSIKMTLLPVAAEKYAPVADKTAVVDLNVSEQEVSDVITEGRRDKIPEIQTNRDTIRWTLAQKRCRFTVRFATNRRLHRLVLQMAGVLSLEDPIPWYRSHRLTRSKAQSTSQAITSQAASRTGTPVRMLFDCENEVQCGRVALAG